MSPGISPRFLSQKSAQNDPEKKMPSTTAKATRRSPKVASEPIHFSAHSAFALTHGTVSIARSSRSRSAGALTYASIKSAYVSEWMFSIAIWKP